MSNHTFAILPLSTITKKTLLWSSRRRSLIPTAPNAVVEPQARLYRAVRANTSRIRKRGEFYMCIAVIFFSRSLSVPSNHVRLNTSVFIVHVEVPAVVFFSGRCLDGRAEGLVQNVDIVGKLPYWQNS